MIISSPSADFDIMTHDSTSNFQRKHREILAGIGVGYGKSGSRRTNYVISSAELYRLLCNLHQHRAVFQGQHGFVRLCHSISSVRLYVRLPV